MKRFPPLLLVLTLAPLAVLTVPGRSDTGVAQQASRLPVAERATTPALPPGLRSRAVGERCAAVRQLGPIEGDAAHDALLAALRDVAPVREAAIAALAGRAARDARARAALRHTADLDPAAQLRVLARAALAAAAGVGDVTSERHCARR